MTEPTEPNEPTEPTTPSSPSSNDTSAGVTSGAATPASDTPAGATPAGETGSNQTPATRPRSGRSRTTKSRKGALNKVLGIGAGILLVGGAGAAVAGAQILEPVGAATAFPIPVAEVPAGEYTGVCPGAPRLLQSEAAVTDDEFSPESETARSTVSAMVLSSLGGVLPGSGLAPLGDGDPLATIAEDNPVGETSDEAVTNEDGLTNQVAGVIENQEVDGVSVFSAQPVGDRAATTGAAMSYTASDGDLSGLAVARCTAPSSDFWILGASTTLGASAVLNLSNPSGTPATVDLELYGSDGPIEAAGTRGLLIPAGATESLVLAGLAANQEQLAVRVVSDGGRVTGSIQQSVLRELTAGGVELLQPAAPPATSQVIPGLRVQDEDTAQEIVEQDGYGTASPEVQVAVPGSTDAVLNVRVYGPEGEVELPDNGVVAAPAGAVTGVSLASLPEGDYTVDIVSDVVITATARLSRGIEVEEPVDFGFAPAGVRLGNTQVAVFPSGSDGSLSFGAPLGRSELQLTPIDADGAFLPEETLGVDGSTTSTITASALGDDVVAVLISASGDPVYGAQIHQLDGAGISVTPLPPGSAGQVTVPVNLGY